MANPLLQLRNLPFAHGGRAVLSGVTMDLAVNEVLVVIGPSGCGKTTLLRQVAGLGRPSGGSIVLFGTVLNDDRRHVVPECRPVGMVFQGLEELRNVGLDGLEDRYPHQLSGGQQQRVAIARSQAVRPQVLLMDEPISDLDAHTRQQVRDEVLRILRAHSTAANIVTHDRGDAHHMADRIAEMDQGPIVRNGSAADFKDNRAVQPFEP
ncbi:MAG: ABC transporter ATP-binding protein [Flavobacteriales bacterium]|nr:MAG: ABC transporter ATP-binding protein [Flavobacteriales bacterium]